MEVHLEHRYQNLHLIQVALVDTIRFSVLKTPLPNVDSLSSLYYLKSFLAAIDGF